MKPVDYERHFPWYIDSTDTDNIDCQCGQPCDGMAGWATHIAEQETTMPTITKAPLQTFGEVWASGHLATDIADKLRCEEVDALADMLRILGQKEAADAWIENHAIGDECGDQHCRCDACR